ncbi:anti-phage deoxyguanosine triphosphatase [Idiomarina loihiensis]|jgi:dGTPase|uniref:anti-phage deoxyguanosine triphosphatase n=1 Tax=Idiomarina TaxID=135575 RepID=UPI0002DD3ED6|nr:MULTISPECIES: anti-phage deoxyguanosine triphosphatase [unclassified Idiomarina]MAA61769.1 dGTPase [Idiomarina sp.]MBL4855746.1 deoxyguanosinetriphosphate triphosphohydrolase family protein [Idiomarina sp.]NWO02684.1 deoxyguanosinetriphosphate triphosphohydrolase family protein [Idiomarinaceae bacterium]HAS23050.1 dNTP triphosphohydrolase [Idiomarina loihiensis]|tara:strand:+ start:77882 stop:79204 length:1323 start_codon:yes stop_codon:yes gene_type:complete
MIWTERQSGTSEQRPNDTRTNFQRDKARILHSAAFRRLQAKTQVMYVGMHDFPRTRLTHSLEASQIGASLVVHLSNQHPLLAEQLELSEPLLESLCLAHDIGHPPFGHGGEIALNYMMRNNGGFEGNGQTFRIVTQLEAYTPEHGMSLTRRTLLGLLKYPVLASAIRRQELPPEVTNFRHLPTREWLPPKALYDDDSEQLDWVLQPLSTNDKKNFQSLVHEPAQTTHGKSALKSIDASIMEAADDIAYGVHDLEDAIVVGLIQRHHWEEHMFSDLQQLEAELSDFNARKLTEDLFSGSHHLRKQAIGGLVNRLLTSARLNSTEYNFDCPLLQYEVQLGAAEKILLNSLKQFIFKWVIRKPEMQAQEFKGQQIVMELFEVLAVEPERLLPENTRLRYLQQQQKGGNALRVISDYLSGMTDGYAAKLYQELFSVSSPKSAFQ